MDLEGEAGGTSQDLNAASDEKMHKVLAKLSDTEFVIDVLYYTKALCKKVEVLGRDKQGASNVTSISGLVSPLLFYLTS